jgi:hypothetical protein
MATEDDPSQIARAAVEAVTSSLTAQVQEVIASAQTSAGQIRREVEAETERRALQTRLAAEEDAARIRRQAEVGAAEYLQHVHARVDELAHRRVDRLTRVSAELLQRADELVARLEEATAVKRQLDDLLQTLSVAAEVAAREAREALITLPSIEQPPHPSHTASERRAHAARR